MKKLFVIGWLSLLMTSSYAMKMSDDYPFKERAIEFYDALMKDDISTAVVLERTYKWLNHPDFYDQLMCYCFEYDNEAFVKKLCEFIIDFVQKESPEQHEGVKAIFEPITTFTDFLYERMYDCHIRVMVSKDHLNIVEEKYFNSITIKEFFNISLMHGYPKLLAYLLKNKEIQKLYFRYSSKNIHEIFLHIFKVLREKYHHKADDISYYNIREMIKIIFSDDISTYFCIFIYHHNNTCQYGYEHYFLWLFLYALEKKDVELLKILCRQELLATAMSLSSDAPCINDERDFAEVIRWLTSNKSNKNFCFMIDDLNERGALEPFKMLMNDENTGECFSREMLRRLAQYAHDRKHYDLWKFFVEQHERLILLGDKF